MTSGSGIPAKMSKRSFGVKQEAEFIEKVSEFSKTPIDPTRIKIQFDKDTWDQKRPRSFFSKTKLAIVISSSFRGFKFVHYYYNFNRAHQQPLCNGPEILFVTSCSRNKDSRKPTCNAKLKLVLKNRNVQMWPESPNDLYKLLQQMTSNDYDIYGLEAGNRHSYSCEQDWILGQGPRVLNTLNQIVSLSKECFDLLLLEMDPNELKLLPLDYFISTRFRFIAFKTCGESRLAGILVEDCDAVRLYIFKEEGHVEQNSNLFHFKCLFKDCPGMISISYKCFKFYSVRGYLGGTSGGIQNDYQKHQTLCRQFTNFNSSIRNSLNPDSWAICGSKSFVCRHSVACNTFYRDKIQFHNPTQSRSFNPINPVTSTPISSEQHLMDTINYKYNTGTPQRSTKSPPISTSAHLSGISQPFNN